MLYDPKWEVKTAPFEPLLDAAMYMWWHGWIQREISNPRGVCIIGAIIHSTEDSDIRNACYDRLAKYLDTKSIGNWNDDICKSKEQAIGAMIGAAAS